MVYFSNTKFDFKISLKNSWVADFMPNFREYILLQSIFSNRILNLFLILITRNFYMIKSLYRLHQILSDIERCFGPPRLSCYLFIIEKQINTIPVNPFLFLAQHLSLALVLTMFLLYTLAISCSDKDRFQKATCPNSNLLSTGVEPLSSPRILLAKMIRFLSLMLLSVVSWTFLFIELWFCLLVFLTDISLLFTCWLLPLSPTFANRVYTCVW